MKTFSKILFILVIITITITSGLSQLHHKDKPLPDLNKTFYIHVHVVLDSLRNPGRVTRNQLDQVLTESSEYFKPIGVDFKTCAFDTIQDYNYASVFYAGRETREMIAKHQEHNRINLYLVNEILSSCNYARFGSIQTPKSAALFMSKNACLEPHRMAHGLGHIFGLLHTYHNRWEELVDGSNCQTAGDKICDTPADPYMPPDTLSVYVQDCEFIHTRLDPNGQYYQPLVGNLMAGYNCPCGFTYDQLELMANNYLNSTAKIW